MKSTILIKEKRTQLVLEYENDHEEEVLKILEKLPNTFRSEFYDCRGGWTLGTENSNNKDLIVVFDHKDKKFNCPIKWEDDEGESNISWLYFGENAVCYVDLEDRATEEKWVVRLVNYKTHKFEKVLGVYCDKPSAKIAAQESFNLTL